MPVREFGCAGAPNETAAAAQGASRPASLTWGRGPDYQVRRRGSAADLVQVLTRVDLRAVELDLEVEVRAGGAPGRTDLGDLLAGAHDVADLHQQLGIVRVQRAVAVAVVDLDD